MNMTVNHSINLVLGYKKKLTGAQDCVPLLPIGVTSKSTFIMINNRTNLRINKYVNFLNHCS